MDKEKLIERVRKLFAMANDASSEHEAAIAAKRMRKLMDEHGITIADLDKSEFLKEAVEQYTNMPFHFIVLGNSAAKMTDTRCVTAKTFENGKRVTRLIFEGLESDVIVARITYDYFLTTMEKALKKNCRDEFGKHKGRKYASSFRGGFASALHKKVLKLASERLKSNSDSKALVVRKDKMIENEFGPVITKSLSPPNSDIRGSADGIEAGSKVGLNKQVKEAGKAARLA